MENLGVEEDTTAQWDQVAPLLDDGLTHLAAKDHEAVVLRFFQKKTFPESATLTGSTEEGARKRVDHAVGKLRRFLTQRGVVVPAAALTATMAANSVQATPLAVTKSSSALSATASLSPLAVQTISAERGLAAIRQVGRRFSQGSYKDTREALTDSQRQR